MVEMLDGERGPPRGPALDKYRSPKGTDGHLAGWGAKRRPAFALVREFLCSVEPEVRGGVGPPTFRFFSQTGYSVDRSKPSASRARPCACSAAKCQLRRCTERLRPRTPTTMWQPVPYRA
jgi:hypothetical protein